MQSQETGKGCLALLLLPCSSKLKGSWISMSRLQELLGGGKGLRRPSGKYELRKIKQSRFLLMG
jgi:hypothetical protein